MMCHCECCPYPHHKTQKKKKTTDRSQRDGWGEETRGEIEPSKKQKRRRKEKNSLTPKSEQGGSWGKGTGHPGHSIRSKNTSGPELSKGKKNRDEYG